MKQNIISKNLFFLKQKTNSLCQGVKKFYPTIFALGFMLLNSLISSASVAGFPIVSLLNEVQEYIEILAGFMVAGGFVYAIATYMMGRNDNPISTGGKWVIGGWFVYNVDWFLQKIGKAGGALF